MHNLFTGATADDAGQHMRWDLQLFAGEGASSGGEGSGDGASEAGAESGTDTMEALGIPKEKLERYRAVKGKQPKKDSQRAIEEQAEPTQDAAAVQDESSDEDPEAGWNDILRNPEYNSRIQDIVQKRVANMKSALDALQPALETLGQKYGMDVSDMSKLDYAELSKRISEDDAYFEDRADEMGSSPETARRVFQAELAEKRRDLSVQEEMARQHFDDLVRQGEALKAKYPNFDLDRELEDPRFFRMTAPGGGWNVEQAYNAIHHNELMQAAQEIVARQASQALSNSIQAGKNLPAENGTVQRTAVGTQPKLYSQMTPEERAVYKQNLKNGNITFGR